MRCRWDKAAERPLLSLEEARRRRTPLDWETYTPPRPAFTGLRVLDRFPLREIVPFIDWSPFFATWELRGTYPRIFENEAWGEKARELFDDAQALLARIVEEARLTARAVYGFFPANARGDDIELPTGNDEGQIDGLLDLLHQAFERSARERGEHPALKTAAGEP